MYADSETKTTLASWCVVMFENRGDKPDDVIAIHEEADITAIKLELE